MSYDEDNQGRRRGARDGSSKRPYNRRGGKRENQDGGKYREEIFSRRISAGKRTYFFDVKSTRSGDDFFITVTESKRVDEGRYEKHKLFLYKEDFAKFVYALHEVINHVREECLPGYDFEGLPELLTYPYDDDDERGY